MPDKRKHRGPHPADAELFSEETIPVLREAVAHFSWLLSRKYAQPSSLKLVGDRFQLLDRQRTSVLRCSCSDRSLETRRDRMIETTQLAGEIVHLDGFNVLTTIEAALAGGVILICRDGCYRDLASMHGSYRKVAETVPALELIGEVLQSFSVGECLWYFDKPVSNSGRICEIVRNLVTERGWNWQAELVDDPDPILIQSEEIVASADSMILDRCDGWINLANEVVTQKIPQANLIDLST